MGRVRAVVWQPSTKDGGRVRLGIYLDPAFAIKCSEVQLTPELKQKLEQYIWTFTKPASWKKEYMPSDMLTYIDDSCLVGGIYHRHASASGQDITIDRASWWGTETVEPIRYSYHQQGRPEDFWSNLWLEEAFGWWAQFMRIQLED